MHCCKKAFVMLVIKRGDAGKLGSCSAVKARPAVCMTHPRKALVLQVLAQVLPVPQMCWADQALELLAHLLLHLEPACQQTR